MWRWSTTIPDGKGDHVVRFIRAAHPSLPILGVSSHDPGNAALREAGATATCRKDAAPQLSEPLARWVPPTRTHLESETRWLAPKSGLPGGSTAAAGTGRAARGFATPPAGSRPRGAAGHGLELRSTASPSRRQWNWSCRWSCRSTIRSRCRSMSRPRSSRSYRPTPSRSMSFHSSSSRCPRPGKNRSCGCRRPLRRSNCRRRRTTARPHRWVHRHRRRRTLRPRGSAPAPGGPRRSAPRRCTPHTTARLLRPRSRSPPAPHPSWRWNSGCSSWWTGRVSSREASAAEPRRSPSRPRRRHIRPPPSRSEPGSRCARYITNPPSTSTVRPLK